MATSSTSPTVSPTPMRSCPDPYSQTPTTAKSGVSRGTPTRGCSTIGRTSLNKPASPRDPRPGRNRRRWPSRRLCVPGRRLRGRRVQRSRVHLWTHGGDVLEGNKVIIDSSESVAGLQTEHSIVADGVAPQAVSTYKEPETKPAFLGGRSVFARNWPYMYALAPDPKISKLKPDQIGITSIPVSEGNSSSSTLGGWNFFINATSQKQVEAWDFVMFMTSEEG